jgi:hypothetical protein
VANPKSGPDYSVFIKYISDFIFHTLQDVLVYPRGHDFPRLKTDVLVSPPLSVMFYKRFGNEAGRVHAEHTKTLDCVRKQQTEP